MLNSPICGLSPVAFAPAPDCDRASIGCGVPQPVHRPPRMRSIDAKPFGLDCGEHSQPSAESRTADLFPKPFLGFFVFPP